MTIGEISAKDLVAGLPPPRVYPTSFEGLRSRYKGMSDTQLRKRIAALDLAIEEREAATEDAVLALEALHVLRAVLWGLVG